VFCDDDEGRKGKERKGDEANALGRGDSPRAPTAQISRSERVRDVTVRYLLRGGVRDVLFVFCRLETRPKRTPPPPFDDDADDAEAWWESKRITVCFDVSARWCEQYERDGVRTIDRTRRKTVRTSRSDAKVRHGGCRGETDVRE
tara:strand:+ start:335 stop:769 length:435 start_codon:yes stop_codon:yes gene_type:complete